jgi:hypothetical protein
MIVLITSYRNPSQTAGAERTETGKKAKGLIPKISMFA